MYQYNTTRLGMGLTEVKIGFDSKYILSLIYVDRQEIRCRTKLIKMYLQYLQYGCQ